MDITNTKYSHMILKEHFKNSLKDSINYLREFAELDHIDDFDLFWKTASAHYLAIKSAEEGDYKKLYLYLDYICNIKRPLYLNIMPLFNDESFELNMILEIMKDDNQVGFGFCKKKMITS